MQCKKILLSLLFVVINNHTYSQNEYSRWYFGYNCGIDFNTLPPSFLLDGDISLVEGGASFCDSNGNLIIYARKATNTSGLTIYNRNHGIVKNGEDLPSSESSTSGCLMVRHPNNPYIHIFTSPFAFDLAAGYRYHVYDIAADSLIIKNQLLITSGSEKITAIDHPNGIDKLITIKQYNTNTYLTYLLNKNGLINCPVTSDAGEIQGPERFTGQGFMKYSFDSKYIANAMMADIGKIQLFKVNEIGKFELYRTINQLGYGIEFSHNGKYMYYTVCPGGGSSIIQYDIKANASSVIATWNSTDKRAFALQMGPDRKIYVANPDSTYLGVINNPDNKGTACNFVDRGFYLGGKKSSYGLPTMNQSYFYTPSVNFKYELECIGNSIRFWGQDTFSATVHQWEVKKLPSGNWQLVSSNKSFIYSLTDTGRYEVRYVAAINSRQDTVNKSITIYPNINKQFLGKDTVYASGSAFNKTLKAPYGMLCQLWQDNSGLATFKADTAGMYICKVTNEAFCEVTDTIIIKECINNLAIPSIYRSKDTLYTNHLLADSFVWFRNNVQYRITQEAFIKLTDTGTYRVEAAKKDHCNRSSSTFQVDKLGVHAIKLQDIGIKLYPNPSNSKVFIQSEKDFKLLVTDITGKVILDTENITEVNLTKGIYLFRFLVNESLIVEKVIIW